MDYIGIFYVLSVIAAIVLYNIKKKLTALRIITTLVNIAGSLMMSFLGMLMIGLSHAEKPYYLVLFGAFSASFTLLMITLIWRLFKKKPIKIITLVLLAAVIAVTGICLYFDIKNDSMPTLDDSGKNFELEYAPYYEKSKVVSLDKESSLKLSGKLPVMDGATALYPVYSAFAKAAYPEEALLGLVEVNASGYPILNECDVLKLSTTTGAYNAIVDGNADIIFVAGPSDAQKKYAEENGITLEYTPIGKEAFVFFVNGKNPMNDITTENIRGIYSAKIQNWSQLGVKGLGKIKAFQRDEGSGSQTALIRMMEKTPIMNPPKSQISTGMGEIIEEVSDYKNYKNAIGFSFRFYSTEMVRNNQIKLLSLDGIAPTRENIENGTYPLTSQFYAVTRSDCSENTKKLVEWILSDEGQEIIEKTGYTGIKN